MLGLLIQDMPLKQRSSDTGPSTGWIQKAPSYLETEILAQPESCAIHSRISSLPCDLVLMGFYVWFYR